MPNRLDPLNLKSKFYIHCPTRHLKPDPSQTTLFNKMRKYLQNYWHEPFKNRWASWCWLCQVSENPTGSHRLFKLAEQATREKLGPPAPAPTYTKES